MIPQGLVGQTKAEWALVAKDWPPRAVWAAWASARRRAPVDRDHHLPVRPTRPRHRPLVHRVLPQVLEEST